MCFTKLSSLQKIRGEIKAKLVVAMQLKLLKTNNTLATTEHRTRQIGWMDEV